MEKSVFNLNHICVFIKIIECYKSYMMSTS